MGYQIIYRYNKEISKGEYDKSEVHEDSVKVGSPYEDVSLDVLAGKVMALFARRNILVVEVDIFEFEKKKISFRESENGIIIKNKKFKFDDGSIIEGEDTKEDVAQKDSIQKEVLEQLLTKYPEILQVIKRTNSCSSTPVNNEVTPPKSVEVAPVVPAVQTKSVLLEQPKEPTINVAKLTSNKKALRWETFDHTLLPGSLAMIKQKGMAFTQGKNYPIYLEKPTNRSNVMSGMVYLTIDDRGVEQMVPDKMFVPAVNLIGGFGDGNEGSNLSDKGLGWTGVQKETMPVLRR